MLFNEILDFQKKLLPEERKELYRWATITVYLYPSPEMWITTYNTKQFARVVVGETVRIRKSKEIITCQIWMRTVEKHADLRFWYSQSKEEEEKLYHVMNKYDIPEVSVKVEDDWGDAFDLVLLTRVEKILKEIQAEKKKNDNDRMEG